MLSTAAFPACSVIKRGRAGPLRMFRRGGWNEPYSLAHDDKDSLIMGGAFSGSSTFRSVEIQEAGGSDLYGAKWKVSPAPVK